MERNVAIELKGICKYFGKVIANKNVNLTVYEGEILSLLGENGSGKTTLMNMISGIYYPDEGQIFIDGKEAVIRSPKDAFKYKIGMIHQHFKLVDNFTAVENIILGIKDGGYNEDKVKERINGYIGKGYKPTVKTPVEKMSFNEVKKCEKEIIAQFNEGLGIKTYPKDMKSVLSRVETISKRYGFDLDFNKKIYEMSVSEKQMVEIIKVLYRGADILILDEPTAVLTPQEIEKLFNILRNMREGGKSIIIITHKLNEVMAISDRVSILRKGEYIGTVDTKDANEKILTEMMVGKKVDLKIERVESNVNKPLLEIRDLSVNTDDGSRAIDDISFYIRGGEILGVAGIAGCGQKELCEALAGLRNICDGQVMHNGESIVGLKPSEIIQKGISMSFIPEDRLGMGLAPSLSITDNMMIKDYNQGKGIFVDRKGARQRAKALIEKLEIVTPSTETPVRRLSGGNVQKVLVGREIETGPNVIITAYPVRGLDINSSYVIYDILNEEKKKGTGVLFIGEDLDVMLALCDKIMVLCKGKNMGVVHADRTTKEEIGLMMTGSLDLNEVKKDKNYGKAKDSNLTEEQWEKAIEESKLEEVEK